MVDKELEDQVNRMEQIKRDLRIINQVAQRLVISHKEQPVLQLNKEVDIEVVQNKPQVYTLAVQDLPTPLRIRIRYLDQAWRQSKDCVLTVTC